MRISLVAARSENRVIGRDGDVPWHLPNDMTFFKKLTTGHVIVMGRKTFESCSNPLPNRHSVVVTRDRDFNHEDVTVARSVPDAIDAAREKAESDERYTSDEVFVVGGSEIYRRALPDTDRMYLTLVHATVEGDTLFPEFPTDEWALESSDHHNADERHQHPYTFEVWERKGPV